MIDTMTLKEIMAIPLPKISLQRKLAYRASQSEVEYVYDLINQAVFDNELTKPNIKLSSRCRKYWGMCYGETIPYSSGSYCEIKLMDKWYCTQWMVTTLAHEMCHQYQWEIFSAERAEKGKDRIMSHGPSFYHKQLKLRDIGISLRTSHSMKKWFKHQDLFKC
jgi:hypothetical protein